MLRMIKSRIHVVRLRVSEFHPYWEGMNVIQLSKIPAFLKRKFLLRRNLNGYNDVAERPFRFLKSQG